MATMSKTNSRTSNIETRMLLGGVKRRSLFVQPQGKARFSLGGQGLSNQSRRSSVSRRSFGSFAGFVNGNKNRRCSIVEERQGYQLALSECNFDEIVIGCDEDGDPFVVQLPSRGLEPGVKTLGKDQNLYEVMESMLNASAIIYVVAALRRLAKTLVIHNNGCIVCFPGKDEIIEEKLEKTDLIYPPSSNFLDVSASEQGEHPTQNHDHNLKKDVDTKTLVEFIEANMELFDESPDCELNMFPGDAWNIFRAQDFMKNQDAYIAEFDDDGTVYAITVNKDEERVTIIFRGTVAKGKDWENNVKFWMASMETPTYLKGTGFDKEIKVHHGFNSYLLDEKRSCQCQKFDKIIDDLKRIYEQEQNSNYELFITGHSLGGAVCTLLAFKIAGSDSYPFLPNCVTAISFGAPKVGGGGFNEGCQILEKEKRLRLIRVSNEGDIVPTVPPRFVGGYTHPGVNIHLKADDEMEVGYHNLKSTLSQSQLVSLDIHDLREYRARSLREDNIDFLLGHTIESLYDVASTPERPRLTKERGFFHSSFEGILQSSRRLLSESLYKKELSDVASTAERPRLTKERGFFHSSFESVLQSSRRLLSDDVASTAERPRLTKERGFFHSPFESIPESSSLLLSDD